MSQALRLKLFTLAQREVQEYRNSFLLTPLVIGGLLVVFMLLSSVFADRISVIGASAIKHIKDDHSSSGMNITISIDDDSTPAEQYIVSEETVEGEEDWNFSREWTFDPQRREKSADAVHEQLSSLNMPLNVLHCFFLALMLLVSINYLLASLHQDRRDRSVLFWKSMPVSEWQEIGIKMFTASIIVPGIYVVISMVTQVFTLLLMMLLLWRMDMNPGEQVLANVDMASLFAGQLSGWLIWSLWTAPFYAWLLLSSAAAKRSPLMLALAIPLALVFVTEVFIGSEVVSNAFSNHVPHFVEEGSQALGFFLTAPEWMKLDYLGMIGGLIVAAGFMAAAVWFRKHRFEM